LSLRFNTAFRANFAGREDFGTTLGADLTNKGIPLLFQSPMTRIFHSYSLL
jgi:hypothetical protein